MFGLFNKKNKSSETISLPWTDLTESTQLDDIIKSSHNTPIVLFKHSTRCSISTAAYDRLLRAWDLNEETVKIYYLDLLAYRNISNEIAQKLNVEHQSPQIVVVKDGTAIFDTSHNGVRVDAIKQALNL